MNVWPMVVPAALAGAGVYSWAAVQAQSQIFGPTVRYTGDKTCVALTFDDGPNPAVTPQLLELLEKHRVRATFFVIGQFVRHEPALTRELAARLHTIGNHTDTHANLHWATASRIAEELGRCRDAVRDLTGTEPKWMRPPWGFRGPHLAGALRKGGFGKTVMWARMAKDWFPQPATRVIERLRAVRGGDIVLLHDGDWKQRRGDRRHVVEALEYWLPRWRDAGIKFQPLNELAVSG